MKYSFSKFIYDTNSNDLTFGKKVIELTKQHKNLLLYYLQNPNRVISKDDLIDHVWNGRVVTSNTIDQSISKLKKILSEVEENKYFETVYGQGIKFCPKISIKNEKKSQLNIIILVSLLLLSTGAFWFYSHWNIGQPEEKPIVMLITKEQNDKYWFDDSSRIYIEQLMTFSDSAILKNINDKPSHLNTRQFIENQLQVSPNMRTVTTEVIEKNNNYTLIITLSDSNNPNKSRSFVHKNIAKTLEQGSQWVQKELKLNLNENNSIVSLTPENPYLVESYLRGLNDMNNGEIDKAGHYFELCIGEKPDFHLARLALAKIKNKQGKLDESLDLLDTLSNIDLNPILNIDIENLRGDIYDTQGKPEKARETYLNILNQYVNYDFTSLNDVRYNLSYSLTVLTEYKKGLEQLDLITDSLTIEQDASFLANVFQKKGSIYQNLGDTQQARENANKALEIFIQSGEM
ncbi:MAG: winged helix-turn-helix domain-containing protein, partial [Marinicellaceae bacterium]